MLLYIVKIVFYGGIYNDILEIYKKSNSGKWIFPLVVNSKIKNIRRIHPLKQKQVDEIVSSIIKEDDVKRLIVFGSATSNMCHEGSDLDICVV